MMQKYTNQQNKQLFKTPSSVQIQQNNKYGTSTTINSSISQIQSFDDQFRKTAIKWLLQFDRKVSKDTNFLAVWYLQVLIKTGYLLKQSNWQLVSASIILFASKMNQIYPPSIASVIKRCKSIYTNITTESLIQMQGQILNRLDFDVAIQSPYNLICQQLKDKKSDIEQCQKLLKIIIYNKQIVKNDSQTISNAIIYLISRSTIDNQLKGQYRQKVKIVAQKMYNFYKEIRKSYEQQKQKQKNLNNVSEMKLNSHKNISITTCKQNMNTQPFSTLEIQNIKKDQKPILKKILSNDPTQLQRVNSFKLIQKSSNLSESTNLPIKQKRMYTCLSKQNLNLSNSHKNIYLYS